MFIDPGSVFEFKLRRSEMYVPPPELWILGPLRAINIALYEAEVVRVQKSLNEKNPLERRQ